MILLRRIFFDRNLLLAALVLLTVLGGTLSARYFLETQFKNQTLHQLSSALSILGADLPPAVDFKNPKAAPLAKLWCENHAKDTPYVLTLTELKNPGESPLCQYPPESKDLETSAGIALSSQVDERNVRLTVTLPRDAVTQDLRLFDLGNFVLILLIALFFWFFWLFSNEDGESPSVALNQIQTDLKRKSQALSQEREELAILMSAISDAIIAVELTGKPLFFNSRFALSFFGKENKNRQPHLGEIFRDPEILDAFHLALEQGLNQQVNIKLYVKSDPIPRFFSLSVAPLRREEGPVYGAVGVFHDVTELKRAENIRIEFVANVSHELRTPLTAIKGYTDTLREDVGRAQYESAPQFLEIIARNVDRLMRLIVDLLDLSSLESQEAAEKPLKDLVDTSDLTKRVLTQLESRRADKGHAIETHFVAEKVFADPARTEQVLVNLLENSVKYVPQGGKISITWEKTADSVLLKVSDNGPGIPLEHHSRLFERFYRVDQARSREMGGTGLGLAIVKHIMQQHGGSVWINSDTGKGTEFVCAFPNSNTAV